MLGGYLGEHDMVAGLRADGLLSVDGDAVTPIRDSAHGALLGSSARQLLVPSALMIYIFLFWQGGGAVCGTVATKDCASLRHRYSYYHERLRLLAVA